MPAIRPSSASLLAALALFSVAASTASAATEVLDFTAAACVSGCGNGAAIEQSFGDSAFVDVSYRSVDSRTNAVIEPFLRYWSTDVGDLEGVAYGGFGGPFSLSEITIAARDGFELSLESLDVATYLGRHATATFTVTDLDGRTILAPTTISTNVPSHNTLSLAGVYARGVVIRWTDSYDNGVDNIRFDVRPAITAAVPEPTTWAMMILGCGVVGTTMRRRRAAAPAAA
ncbi:MAG: PEPxxWA-CTERM sorting domain-containing protein [Pseudomonadota bacterium]